MPFTYDQYTIILINHYTVGISQVFGGFYTSACDTRVNASGQTRDILRYSMINQYIP